MSSVHITLAVSGLSGVTVNMVDRGRVVQRPLCSGQTDIENAKVSTNKMAVKAGNRLVKVAVKEVSTVV